MPLKNATLDDHLVAVADAVGAGVITDPKFAQDTIDAAIAAQAEIDRLTALVAQQAAALASAQGSTVMEDVHRMTWLETRRVQAAPGGAVLLFTYSASDLRAGIDAIRVIQR